MFSPGRQLPEMSAESFTFSHRIDRDRLIPFNFIPGALGGRAFAAEDVVPRQTAGRAQRDRQRARTIVSHGHRHLRPVTLKAGHRAVAAHHRHVDVGGKLRQLGGQDELDVPRAVQFVQRKTIAKLIRRTA